jgi:putative membrane protein
MNSKLHLPFAIALAFAATPGWAQQQQSAEPGNGRHQQQPQQQQSQQRERQGSERVAVAGQQTPQEGQQFLKTATQLNIAEIKVAQLAMERGQSQQVKNLAQMIAHDHTKGLAQTLSVTVAMNMVAPTDPPADAQQEYDKLKGLSGDQFDKEFVSYMIKGHEKAIDMFNQEAQSGQNMQVQQLAKEQLPVLKKHLEMAQMAQKGSGDKLGANLPGRSQQQHQ